MKPKSPDYKEDYTHKVDRIQRIIASSLKNHEEELTDLLAMMEDETGMPLQILANPEPTLGLFFPAVAFDNLYLRPCRVVRRKGIEGKVEKSMLDDIARIEGEYPSAKRFFDRAIKMDDALHTFPNYSFLDRDSSSKKIAEIQEGQDRCWKIIRDVIFERAKRLNSFKGNRNRFLIPYCEEGSTDPDLDFKFVFKLVKGRDAFISLYEGQSPGIYEICTPPNKSKCLSDVELNVLGKRQVHTLKYMSNPALIMLFRYPLSDKNLLDECKERLDEAKIPYLNHRIGCNPHESSLNLRRYDKSTDSMVDVTVADIVIKTISECGRHKPKICKTSEG